MKRTLPTLLASFFLASLTPFTLHADSLTVEGDLKVEASGTAQGDLAVDNKLTVNPGSGVKSAFTVEPNGVIWAGEGTSYNATEMIPEGPGARLMWIPQKGAFRVGRVRNDYWDIEELGNIGFGSVGLGNGRAKGMHATAWGHGSADGEYSTAWGNYASADGEYSTAWGRYASADGKYSTAWGEEGVATGVVATVWGYYNYAGGVASTAWGDGSMALGWGSTAWGVSTSAEAYLASAFGRYNIGGFTYFDDGNSNNDGDKKWFDLDPLLEIGNGTHYSHRSNALTVIKNGQTTLQNKYWDEENPTAIPADPNTTLAGDQSSAGEALVVKGHARFGGNVTMPRQGDIWMGAFGNPEDSGQQGGS
ncbi:hypothetical protein H5P28_15545 [Ruficoccus amylovorans]|uniref:Trimeric autotransporter adhesin YadA-like head domain-containing protein n=1 Tax=Ruficoccus amylovorans TaxID=1804625 RepID=A0A842HGY8_9BACT|nr:hypothetical protein [Ruficoccus amylovorans]MBC2595682.1 hypothetical protein [Ruficoccus amylovorans]